MKYLSILLIALFSFLSSCTKDKNNDPTPTAVTSDIKALAPTMALTPSNVELISSKAWRLNRLYDGGTKVVLTANQKKRVYAFNPDFTYLERNINVVVKQGTWEIDDNEIHVTSNGTTEHYAFVEITEVSLVYYHTVSLSPQRVLRYEFSRPK